MPDDQPKRRDPALAFQKATRISARQPELVEATAPPVGLPEADMGPVLKSLGKPISELLSLVLEQAGPVVKGIPKRIRLTQWDALNKLLEFHGLNNAAERMQVSPGDLDRLISEGVLQIPGSPKGQSATIQKKLQAALDAPR